MTLQIFCNFQNIWYCCCSRILRLNAKILSKENTKKDCEFNKLVSLAATLEAFFFIFCTFSLWYNFCAQPQNASTTTIQMLWKWERSKLRYLFLFWRFCGISIVLEVRNDPFYLTIVISMVPIRSAQAFSLMGETSPTPSCRHSLFCTHRKIEKSQETWTLSISEQSAFAIPIVLVGP